MCENIRRQKALNTICICAVIALLLSLVFMAIFSTTTASAEDQLTSGADSTISTPSDNTLEQRRRSLRIVCDCIDIGT